MRKLFPVLTTLLVAVCFAAPATAAQCRSLSLSPQPYWVFSGAWSSDGSSILLLDVARKSLLSYPVDGTPGEVVLGSGQVDADRQNQLSLIQKDGTGFVLEGPNGQLQRLGPGLDTADEIGWSVVESDQEPGLQSLDSWAVSGDQILLYGDYRHFSGSWLSVFAKASLDDLDDLEILHWLPAREPARQFYLKAQQFLTTLHGKGYFLLQTEPVSVWEVDLLQEGTESLRQVEDVVPQRLRRQVEIPAARGVDSTEAMFTAQARAQSIVALYAQGDHLYLLGREPGEAPGNRWSLTVVDPTADRVVRTLYLPTTAPHLLVLPGDEYWAVVEKGEVEAFGNQHVQGALLLPTEWFSKTHSPLTRANAAPICR